MTKKTKKIIWIVIGIALILAIVIGIARCDRKTYVVSIGIYVKKGDGPMREDEWETPNHCLSFLADEDYLRVFIPYDGIRRRFILTGYCLYHESGRDNCPVLYSRTQYNPSDDFFSEASTYISPEGEREGSVWGAKDIGEYFFGWSTRNPDWEYRSVNLHITIYDPDNPPDDLEEGQIVNW